MRNEYVVGVGLNGIKQVQSIQSIDLEQLPWFWKLKYKVDKMSHYHMNARSTAC